MYVPDHCIDYRGRRIEFPDKSRRHILRNHPAIAPYLSRICEVLSEPDLVYSRSRSNTHLYYKLGICSDQFNGRFMVVYVRYNNFNRWVATCHSTSHPATADFLIFQR